MKTKFTENLQENQLIGERTFNAPIEKLWKAWTNPDLIAQWWAPKPYRAETLHMEFREGGHWIYCMVSPEGQKHYGRMDYLEIQKPNFFNAQDYFCDEKGNRSEQFPPMHMEIRFQEVEGQTTITSTTTFASAEVMKQMAEMGMVEGFNQAYDQLEEMVSG